MRCGFRINFKSIAASLGLIALGLLADVHAAENSILQQAWKTNLWYQVKPGENVFQIFKSLGICEPKNSGCKKWLEKTRALNPDEVRKNGDLVYQYAQLVLPIKKLSPGIRYQVSDRREVTKTSNLAQAPKPKPQQVQKQVPVIKRSVASVNTFGEVQTPTPAPIPSLTLAPAPIRSLAPTPPIATISRNFIELAPYFAAENISSVDQATGGTAQVASSLSAGIDVKDIHAWSEGFHSFLHLKLGSLSFSQPTTPGQSLENRGTFVYGMGLGGDFKLSSRLNFEAFFNYQKEAFASSISTTSVSVDTVAIPELGGKLDLDVIKTSAITLGLSGEYTKLFQASTDGYAISPGSLEGGLIYFRRNLNASETHFQTELGYFERQQDTSLTNQSEKEVLLQIRWTLPFGQKEVEGR
jgi:hypothetical protein